MLSKLPTLFYTPLQIMSVIFLHSCLHWVLSLCVHFGHSDRFEVLSHDFSLHFLKCNNIQRLFCLLITVNIKMQYLCPYFPYNKLGCPPELLVEISIDLGCGIQEKELCPRASA